MNAWTLGVIPGVIAEKLLVCANSGASGEGDGFDGFAWKVGEETPAIGAEVFEASGMEVTLVVIKKSSERRANGPNLFISHATPSASVGG